MIQKTFPFVAVRRQACRLYNTPNLTHLRFSFVET